MPETEPMTTAEALIAFHRELVEGGLPTELVHVLMSDAGRALVNGGGYLAVRNSEQADA